MQIVKLNNSNGDKLMVKLIDRGCELDVAVKELQDELKAIKTELTAFPAGKYKTPNANQLTISESETYTDIDPAEAKQMLRSKRLGQYFLGCVKVQVTALAKLLNDIEMASLRKPVDVTRRYSFK